MRKEGKRERERERERERDVKWYHPIDMNEREREKTILIKDLSWRCKTFKFEIQLVNIMLNRNFNYDKKK